MNYIPALFSTSMVQAIQIDTKTITRRTGGLEKINEDPGRYKLNSINEAGIVVFEDTTLEIAPWIAPIKCPFGGTGDILWVREAFYAYGYWVSNGVTKKRHQCAYQFIDKTQDKGFDYKYHDTKPDKVEGFHSIKMGWYQRASIHMPKAACRLWLEKTKTRAERLQDISNEDAKNEGVLLHENGRRWLNYYDQHFNTTQFIYNCNDAAESFKTLWWVVNGRESWFENPWVWVNSFKRVNKPEGWPVQ